MSRAKVDFFERKAKAEETVKWLWADLQRSEGNGEPGCFVKLSDLKEVLAYVEAVRYRESTEYGGTHLGFGRPDDMARLKRQEIKACMVMAKKTEKYCIPIGFTARIQITKHKPAFSPDEIGHMLDDDKIPLGKPLAEIEN